MSTRLHRFFLAAVTACVVAAGFAYAPAASANWASHIGAKQGVMVADWPGYIGPKHSVTAAGWINDFGPQQ